jgi:flagellin
LEVAATAVELVLTLDYELSNYGLYIAPTLTGQVTTASTIYRESDTITINSSFLGTAGVISLFFNTAITNYNVLKSSGVLVNVGGFNWSSFGDYLVNRINSAGSSFKYVEQAEAFSTFDIATVLGSTYGTRFDTVFALDSFQFGGFYGLDSSNMHVIQSGLGGIQNASILLEVVNVDTGNGAVTFRAQVNEMAADGTLRSLVDENLIIRKNGVNSGYDKLGFTFLDANAIVVDNLSTYDVGDKIVLNFQSEDAAARNDILVEAQLNEDWPDAWLDSAGNGATQSVKYRVDANSLKNQTVQFKQFYLNSENGKVYEGNIKISFNTAFKEMTAGSPTVTSTDRVQRASFEAAYIGQVAKGDVKLRDLDKFWDANGKFMLDDPKQLTIYQGDGNKTSVTLYATDTLNDVRSKLNDAIAYGLGQSQYVKDQGAEFVSFVDEAILDNPMSVMGTFVIRSVVPGAAGSINFSGDEDIIKALSLNIIQDAKETAYRVSVADAHDATNIASNVKITGNVLYGVVNPNVDIEFDAMANVNVAWNYNTKKFDFTKENGTYQTIIHLADNTTVFQIGANEGEDMSVNIGDMTAHALGVDAILVTDRESAARSITLIDNAISKVSTLRAKLGAYQNRLEHTITNLTTASTNTTAAESRIRDADMAKEMMEFTKLNILSQAGNSMLAQANQLPQNVLSLLR